MYTCKHFTIEELVDKHTFEKWGDNSWQFFNPDALRMIDGIREYFGKSIIINNWKWGGNLQLRGLRPCYVDIGAKYSLHRIGSAFDLTIKGMDAEDVRKEILENKGHELLKYVNCIEADVSWLHADNRNIPDRIRVVHP